MKVLDFGLAKAMEPSGAQDFSPAGMTSPDIWAFGAVLYEMVTGRRLAAVIKEEPSWDGVPTRVRRLLQRCLEKDPTNRLRDISGVGLLLEETSAGVAPARRLPWIAAGTLALVAVLALASLWVMSRRTQPEPRALVRVDIDLGAGLGLGATSGYPSWSAYEAAPFTPIWAFQLVPAAAVHARASVRLTRRVDLFFRAGGGSLILDGSTIGSRMGNPHPTTADQIWYELRIGVQLRLF